MSLEGIGPVIVFELACIGMSLRIVIGREYLNTFPWGREILTILLTAVARKKPQKH